MSTRVSGRGKNGEAVLHLAFSDGDCGAKWGEIVSSAPKEMVVQELHRALEYKFDMEIPKPLDMIYKYWDEGAW